MKSRLQERRAALATWSAQPGHQLHRRVSAPRAPSSSRGSRNASPGRQDASGHLVSAPRAPSSSRNVREVRLGRRRPGVSAPRAPSSSRNAGISPHPTSRHHVSAPRAPSSSRNAHPGHPGRLREFGRVVSAPRAPSSSRNKIVVPFDVVSRRVSAPRAPSSSRNRGACLFLRGQSRSRLQERRAALATLNAPRRATLRHLVSAPRAPSSSRNQQVAAGEAPWVRVLAPRAPSSSRNKSRRHRRCATNRPGHRGDVSAPRAPSSSRNRYRLRSERSAPVCLGSKSAEQLSQLATAACTARAGRRASLGSKSAEQLSQPGKVMPNTENLHVSAPRAPSSSRNTS